MCNAMVRTSFILAVVTLIFELLSRLDLRNHKACCDLYMTFDLGSAKMFSSSIFETYSPMTKIYGMLQLNYLMYFYLIVTSTLTPILQLIVLQLHKFWFTY